jgi:hypothetical protein
MFKTEINEAKFTEAALLECVEIASRFGILGTPRLIICFEFIETSPVFGFSVEMVLSGFVS